MNLTVNKKSRSNDIKFLRISMNKNLSWLFQNEQHLLNFFQFQGFFFTELKSDLGKIF